MEWTALGKISTGITLIAFIAALVAAAYRASVKGRINALKALPPKDRLAAVTQTLNTFGISSANLTRENAYQIALHELSIKDRRYKLIAVIVVVLALIFAIVAVYAIYDTGQKRVESSGVSSDALAVVVAASTKEWRSVVENNQQTIRALERQHDLTEVQLRALLTQVGRDPGTATGEELTVRFVALVKELQEGKAVLRRVDTAPAGTINTAVRAQAEEAFAQGNLPALNESLKSLLWRWPHGAPKEIKVCWEVDVKGFDQEKQIVKEAITSSWQANSPLRFVGWGTCSDDQKGIRIAVGDESPHTQSLGSSLDGRSRGMILNFTFKQWATQCSASLEQKALCIKATAVHEFGHALGFGHEQEKPGTPPECQAAPTGPKGIAQQNPYDPNSVMNFCNPVWLNDGILSDGDRAALKILYGSDSPAPVAGGSSHSGGPSAAAPPPKP